DAGRLTDVLRRISPDVGYDNWLKVLMALHTETGGSDDGLKLAIEWSRPGQKFKDEDEVRTKWKTFRPDTGNNVTFATLIHMAKPQPASDGKRQDAQLKVEMAASEDELRRAQQTMSEAVERARNGQHLVAVEESTIKALAAIKRGS